MGIVQSKKYGYHIRVFTYTHVFKKHDLPEHVINLYSSPKCTVKAIYLLVINTSYYFIKIKNFCFYSHKNCDFLVIDNGKGEQERD